MTTLDLYDAWITAGDTLQPYGDWIVTNWVNLAAAVSFAVVGWRILRWAVRPRVPAAHDNQPPADDGLLATCQHIAREPERHPDAHRAANRYLRQKGDETP